jgi:hypothetical protein
LSKSKPFNLPHNPRESELHASVAEFLDWALLPQEAIYTTFPAGWGKLNKGTAGRLHASGMKRGMPDILVFGRRSRVVGLELKVGANSVTAAQREMFAKLQGIGIRVYICRSIEDVADALKQEQIPCRRLEISASGQGSAKATEPAATPPPDFSSLPH